MASTQLIYVSGRVQGIGFRDWTVRSAKRLGLIGWVRNLRDGRVEILASGEDAALAALVDACRTGPASAEVDNVETAPGELNGAKGFTKRFTA